MVDTLQSGLKFITKVLALLAWFKMIRATYMSSSDRVGNSLQSFWWSACYNDTWTRLSVWRAIAVRTDIDWALFFAEPD